jgi:phage shock protein A
LDDNQKLQDDKRALEAQVSSLEKAKENYKDQALELKSELKQARAQLNSRTACSTKFDQQQNESCSLIKEFENT